MTPATVPEFRPFRGLRYHTDDLDAAEAKAESIIYF